MLVLKIIYSVFSVHSHSSKYLYNFVSAFLQQKFGTVCALSTVFMVVLISKKMCPVLNAYFSHSSANL